MAIDATGLTVPKFADLRAGLRSDMVAALAAVGVTGVDLSGASLLGIFIDVIAVRLAVAYEGQLGSYLETRVSSATGVNLDALAFLQSLTRETASPSTGTITITCSAANITIDVGDVFTTDGGISVEVTTSAVSVDLGGGVFEAAVSARVTTGGPTAIPVGTVWQVPAAPTLLGVRNDAAFALGSPAESDDAFRIRIQERGAAPGIGSYQSIRSRVEALAEVSQCVVLNNSTPVIDANGVPGNAFEVVVWPAPLVAERAAVFQAIWRYKPAGITAHGDISGTATDALGGSQNVAFSVASAVSVHLRFVISATGSLPSNTLAQLQALVTSQSAAQSIGQDVILQAYETAAWSLLSGQATLISIEVRGAIGVTPGPSDTGTVTIGGTSIAQFSTSNVTLEVV